MRPAPEETSRLRFRLVRLGDEAILSPEIDEALTEHWIGWEPGGVAQVRRDVERAVGWMERAEGFEFLAFGKEDEAFIGLCHLIPYPGYPGELDIGVWVRRAAQGKGYATEMVGALVAWAKGNLGVPYLVYSVTEGNAASEAIIRKIGAPVLREYVATKRGKERRVTDYRVALKTSSE